MAIKASNFITVADVTDGQDSVTVLLTDENHTFSASSSGQAEPVSIVTNILAYKGSGKTAATVGGISGLPTGMTMTVQNNGTANASIKIAVTSALTSPSGSVTISIMAEGISLQKVFSYNLSKAGEKGEDGTPAKVVSITASSQIFKSSDGGLTFSPDTIKLTPAFQGGITYAKWRYSVNGGSSWSDVVSGSAGLSISSGILTISKTCSLFTETVSSISFQCLSSNPVYSDIITIAKLYDVTELSIGGTNLAELTNQGILGWTWFLQSGSYSKSEVLVNGIPCCQLSRDNSAQTGSSSILYPYIGREKYEAGQQYTISFDVKPSVSTSFQASLCNPDGSASLVAKTRVVQNTASADRWNTCVFIVTLVSALPSSKDQNLTLTSMDSGKGVRYLFRNLMIEKGNTNSAWSPAPEDLQFQVTEIKSSVTNVSSTVDNINKKIIDKIWSSDISKQIDDYNKGTVSHLTERVNLTEKSLSGTKETIGTIQTKLNAKADSSFVESMNQKLLEVEKTADGIETTVSNIKFGTDNLLYNSTGELGNADGWSSHLSAFSSVKEKSFFPGQTGYALSLENDTKEPQWAQSKEMALKPNTEYTLSGYCYLGDEIKSCTVQFVPGDSSSSEPIDLWTESTRGEWFYFSAHVTTDPDTGHGSIRLCNNGFLQYAYSCICYFCDLIFVEGNQAVAWSLPSSDIQTTAEQTAEKVSWLVKSGTSSTNFTLTDKMAELITEKLVIKNATGDSTIISGGRMDIDQLFAGEIHANGKISGLELEGATGNFKGVVTATSGSFENVAIKSGTIAGLEITPNKLIIKGTTQVAGDSTVTPYNALIIDSDVNGQYLLSVNDGIHTVDNVLTIRSDGSLFAYSIQAKVYLTCDKEIHAGGEICSSSSNAFRSTFGGYGFIIRNDGNSSYFLLTNKGNAQGAFNGLRPLSINNSSGVVTMGNGLVASSFTCNGSTTLNGDLVLKGNRIEFYGASPYIDFHHGNSTTDYTSRIISQNDRELTVNNTTFFDYYGTSQKYGIGFMFRNYGGGWNMTDSTWIRSYNGKSIYTKGNIQCDGNLTSSTASFSGAVYVAGNLNRPNGASYRINDSTGTSRSVVFLSGSNYLYINYPECALTVLRGNKAKLVDASGTVVTSDRRLKKDINPLSENYLKAFMELELVNFRYIKHPEQENVGLIYQDAKATLEKYGIYDFSGIDDPDLECEDEDLHYGALNYDQFHNLHMAVTQKSILEIQNLQKRIDDYEKRISQLEAFVNPILSKNER